ncbi:hypothetical protein RJ641_023575 [Dillenia turbinata]|uniref:Lipase-like C-terminal domain-containing protein n=1 Tax=Dillenia turbinata TaxID=194707 RepID=A0AAN8UJ84_9MAGN
MVVRWWISGIQLMELVVSCVVHLLYTFYIYSTAVAYDLSQFLYEFLTFRSNSNVGIKELETQKIETPNHLPAIVLVHGIFGFGKGRLGGLSYFAGAEKKDERVLVPDLGSLTSIYDRARELFYYLKGGQVDYGEEHSKTCGHSHFGRIYEQGHYPEWDEDHPIHFVGHSAGAQVIRLLQQMLADKAFKGPKDGRTLKPICLLQVCRVGVIIYDWLDIALLKSYYNFGFDHFNMSWRKIGILGLVDYLLGNAGPFASGDWILPDLTIQGSMQLNCHLDTFPNTFYFSYATKRTRKLMGFAVPSGILSIHPLLFLRVLQMSQWCYPPDVPPPYKGYRDEDWQDNDGALNSISMTHPRLPIEHPSHFVVNDSECHPLQPGIWKNQMIPPASIAQELAYLLGKEYKQKLVRDGFESMVAFDVRLMNCVGQLMCEGGISSYDSLEKCSKRMYYKIVEADHMLFIINRERAGVQFDLIYDNIFERCRKHVFKKAPPTLPNTVQH